MEDKESTKNLNIIDLTLSQIQTQAQEKILVLYKQVEVLQTHANAKIPTSERPVMDKKTKETKSKCYFCTHKSTLSLDHTRVKFWFPKIWRQVEATLGDKMSGIKKFKEEKDHK